MATPTIILASASPRRVELLRELTAEFRVVPSEATEIHLEQLTAREVCQVNAYRKARWVAKQFPDALVIGADTLVTIDNQLLGKPVDLVEARQMLERLQGRTHEVVTGVCLTVLREHRQRVFVEATAVTFRSLAAGQIGRYLELVNPLDKAGAYAIQEHGDLIVANADGSTSNVVGLPLERLRTEFRNWNRPE